MSLEEIRKRIDSEAKAEAVKVKDEGSSEADSILVEARAQADSILKAARVQGAREADRIKKEVLSGAQIEANAMLLGARESVIDSCMDKVKQQVESKLSDKKMLGRLMDSASAEFETIAARRDMVVRAERSRIADVRKMGFVVQEGAEGELSISSRDGSMAIDISPHSLAEKYEADGRSMLLRRIFGSGK